MLLTATVVLGLQGCSPGPPSVNLRDWVRSPYVAGRRSVAVAAFDTWLSALRRTGLTVHVQAVDDGCGQWAQDTGNLYPPPDWGVSCGRGMAVTVVATHGMTAAQATITRALTKVGWMRWQGTLAIPAGCRTVDGQGGVRAKAVIQPDAADVVLSEWRLICPPRGDLRVARYGPAASGCASKALGEWITWALQVHRCRPIGVLSPGAARRRIVIEMAARYVTVDEGTSTHTTPPPVGSGG